jgi:hypothetical protein
MPKANLRFIKNHHCSQLSQIFLSPQKSFYILQTKLNMNAHFASHKDSIYFFLIYIKLIYEFRRSRGPLRGPRFLYLATIKLYRTPSFFPTRQQQPQFKK